MLQGLCFVCRLVPVHLEKNPEKFQLNPLRYGLNILPLQTFAAGWIGKLCYMIGKLCLKKGKLCLMKGKLYAVAGRL